MNLSDFYYAIPKREFNSCDVYVPNDTTNGIFVSENDVFCYIGFVVKTNHGKEKIFFNEFKHAYGYAKISQFKTGVSVVENGEIIGTIESFIRLKGGHPVVEPFLDMKNIRVKFLSDIILCLSRENSSGAEIFWCRNSDWKFRDEENNKELLDELTREILGRDHYDIKHLCEKLKDVGAFSDRWFSNYPYVGYSYTSTKIGNGEDVPAMFPFVKFSDGTINEYMSQYSEGAFLVDFGDALDEYEKEHPGILKRLEDCCLWNTTKDALEEFKPLGRYVCERLNVTQI